MKILKKNKIIIIFIIIGILVISFATFKLFIEKEKHQQMNNNESSIKKETEETTTIILSINPKLALVIDKEGNIISIYPLNEDANIFVNKDFEGLKLDEAVEKVVEVAEVYFEEKAEISLFVSDGEEKQVEQIESLFNSKGIKTHKLDMDEKEKKEIDNKIKQEKEKRKKEEKTTTTKKRTTKKLDENTTTTTTTKKIEETTTKAKSNNNYLKSLNIENASIDFYKHITIYENIVPYNITSINISAIAEDNKSNVDGTGNKNLIIGENNFIIKVTAEDGSTKEYIIKVVRRPLVNLNENKVYHYQHETANDEYVYPNNPDCFNKQPHEVIIPEGYNYNEYCQNTPPTNYPNIEGIGYYCDIQDAHNNSDNMYVNKVYVCHFIKEIVTLEEIKARVNEIIKVGNYVGFAGGFGIDPEQLYLDEDKCNKYNIPCGRW